MLQEKWIAGARRTGLVALGIAVLASAPSSGATNCPGDQVTRLPYSDAGVFPAGDEFDPTGVDFSGCGLDRPITGNGADFVVVFHAGADPDFQCTLQASAPVLTVLGEGLFVCVDPQGWLRLGCYTAHVGTDIDVLEGAGFFGAAALMVDSLGNPGTTFTLECDGALAVELEALTIE